VAPNTTQPGGDSRTMRLADSLVSPVCSLGWSMPASRSTGPFLLRISSFPRPKIPVTWLSFILVMFCLYTDAHCSNYVYNTSISQWLDANTEQLHCQFFFLSSDFSNGDAYFLPLRPSSSATDNLIKLTWAPKSRSRFPCFLMFPDPRIFTSRMGRIACWLLLTAETVTVVAEFFASAMCINGWWKYLHWFPWNYSLHWRLREQLEALWSRPARFRQEKQPWFSLISLRQSLGLIDINLGHWSVHWIDVLYSQLLWFTGLFSTDIWLTYGCVTLFSTSQWCWISFLTSFRMSSKTLMLPVWSDILWSPRNETKLCGHRNTFFVQWSLTCDYYPCNFVAQLSKGCWNFVSPGVQSHKSGRLPRHEKAWIRWCLV